ncbi:hypothetical protein [Aeoliella sp.]|uniref:hypothetical protein n=1 Tax=Aeoliella sp. TaxID=2795800 RepID=UPI003CCC3D63
MKLHHSRNTVKLTAGVVVCALVVTAGQVSAAMLTNGDFEEATFDSGWINSGATAADELVLGGNTTSAELDGGDSLRQEFAASDAEELLQGTAEFYLRFADFTDGTRIRLRGDGNASDLITLRVNSTGQLQRFSGSWGDIAVPAFSQDETYRVQIALNDLAGSRTFDVFTSAGEAGVPSGELALANSDTGLTAFHSAPLGTGLGTLTFEAGNSVFRLDNVSVEIPEPSTIALGGLILGLTCLYHRRQR